MQKKKEEETDTHTHTIFLVLPKAYSKAKLKSCGGKVYPCFRPFWIGKLSDKYLPIRTLLYILFKHSLISLTSSLGTQNSYQNIIQYFPHN
jgi:hypothetical protein